LALKFISIKPDLPQRIPQYLVVSYLSVTPEIREIIRETNKEYQITNKPIFKQIEVLDD